MQGGGSNSAALLHSREVASPAAPIGERTRPEVPGKSKTHRIGRYRWHHLPKRPPTGRRRSPQKDTWSKRFAGYSLLASTVQRFPNDTPCQTENNRPPLRIRRMNWHPSNFRSYSTLPACSPRPPVSSSATTSRRCGRRVLLSRASATSTPHPVSRC